MSILSFLSFYFSYCIILYHFISHFPYCLYRASIKISLLTIQNDKGHLSTSAGAWCMTSCVTLCVTYSRCPCSSSSPPSSYSSSTSSSLFPQTFVKQILGKLKKKMWLKSVLFWFLFPQLKHVNKLHIIQ